MEVSISISHLRIIFVSVMTGLRQILLIPLLVISVESFWPLPWLHNTFVQPQSRHLRLQHLPPLFTFRKIPYNDIITLKSVVQDDISDYDVIVKRITVKKYPRYDEDKFYSGIGPHRFIWIDNIEEDIIESDNYSGNKNNFDDEDTYSGVDSLDIDDATNYVDDINDSSDEDDINDRSNVDNTTDDAKINNDNKDVKKQDDLNTRPNDEDKVSDVIKTTNNQKPNKPFINESKPNNADEDLRIDPRKDEVEIKKEAEK